MLIYRVKHVIAAAIAVAMQLVLVAQEHSVTMQYGSRVEVDARTNRWGVLYDNGGVNGNYRDNSHDTVRIDAGEWLTLHLTGQYETESNYDFIYIYDGEPVQGNLIGSRHDGTGTIDVTATNGVLTIVFTTDGSGTRWGFELYWQTSGYDCDQTLCGNTVSSVEVSDITNNRATISWQAESGGPYYLKLNGQTHVVDGNQYEAEGLNANTFYTAYVSTEEQNEICCWQTASFRTKCGTMQAPVIENFDDIAADSTLPPCWQMLTNIDGQQPVELVNTVYYSTGRALRMTTTRSGYWSMAILPEVEDDMNTLTLRLKMRAPYSGAKLEVGVCNQTTLIGNGYTAIGTITATTANAWQEFVIPLGSYVGEGHHLALRMNGAQQPGEGYSVFIDNMVIEKCGVWNIGMVKRNAHTLWMQWSEYGSPTVNAEYGPTGFLPGQGVRLNGVSSPLMLDSLNPDTQYELRLYATCEEGGVEDEYESGKATTLAKPAVSISLCEGFEAGSIPSGWRRHATYDNTPEVSTSYKHSGSRALRMRPDRTSTMPMIVLPMIDTVQIQSLSVGFWVYSDDYTTCRVVVGVMEYPEVVTSFVPVDTVYVSGSRIWTRYEVPLENYVGNGKYIALRVFDANTSYNSMYIDDLEVGQCMIAGVMHTNVASRSVDILWNAVGETFHGDSVVVEYGAADVTPDQYERVAFAVKGNGVRLVGGKQSVTLEGLEPNTNYIANVYAMCDTGVYCKAYGMSFRTLEQDLTLPYCVTFENIANGAMPAGWTRTSIYGSEPSVATNVAFEGVGSLKLSARGGLNYEHSVATLPMLDVDDINGLTLTFRANSNYNSTRSLQIGVMTDPNDESTFTTLMTYSPTYNNWSSYVLELSNYSGDGRYIAFRWFYGRGSYNYSCYIDALIVSDAATSGKKVSSVTSHGATFTWNGRGRSYNGAVVEWGPAGFARGTGTSDTVDADVFSYTVDTLQSGRSYDAYITAVSSTADNACDYSKLSFTTFAEPTAASYCQGFEDVAVDGFPIGWTRPEQYDNTPRVLSNNVHSGGRSLYFYSYNCSTPYHARAVMPYLEEDDLTGITLRFGAMGDGARTHLTVGMTSNPNGSGDFDTLATFPVNHWNVWREYSVDLGEYTGSGRHIVFRYATPISCNSGRLYVDDITISRCRVTSVRAYGATQTGVTIDWQPEGTADSVVVEYGPTGFNHNGGYFASTTDTVITLTGLNPSTTYDFYVYPHCSGSSLACNESKYSFTTTHRRVGDGYCDDMEDNAGNSTMPHSWSRPLRDGEWPYIWTSNGSEYWTSSHSALEFRTPNGGGNIAVLPRSEDDVKDLILSFSMRTDNEYHSDVLDMIVGVMPNPFDADAFVPIDTLRPTFDFEQYDVSLAAYTGDYQYIALKFTDTHRSGFTIFLDDVTLTSRKVKNAKVSAITNHSATLWWERMQYADSTIVILCTDEQTIEQGMHLRTTATTLELDQLTPSTTYTAYFYALGQDTNAMCMATTISFSTLDQPMAIPVCIDMEESVTANALPRGWTRPYGTAESGITSDVKRFGAQSIKLHSDSVETHGTRVRDNMLVLPMLEVISLDDVWLDFYLVATRLGIDLQVGIMTDPNDSATFTLVQTITPATVWQRGLVDLGQYSGTGRYVALRAHAHSGVDAIIYIDNINIRDCVVRSARVTSPTHHSLTVVAEGTTNTAGYVVEYKAVGGYGVDFVAGAGQTVSIDGSSYMFADLEEATWYAFHIYPNCGSGSDGCNFVTVYGQTLHPVVDIPYCENFDNYSAGNYLNNWRNLSTYSNDYPTTSAAPHHNGGNSLYFRAEGEKHSMAVMPQLYVGETCPVVDSLYANFWVICPSGTGAAALLVGTVIDANDEATFVASDTIRFTQSTEWEHHTVGIHNFSSNNTYVAYKVISLDGTAVELYLDDLCMEKCVASDVTVSNITQNSVTVSWTSYGVDSLMCEYGPRGFVAGSGTTVELHNSPAVIDGLLDGTDYQFVFASVCGCNMYGATYQPGGGSSGVAGGWSSSGWYCPIVDTLRTQASYLIPPYCEDFEAYDTIEFPRSWRRIGNNNVKGYPALTTKNHHSGKTSLVFYAQPGWSNYAALAPLMPGTTQGLVLSFYAYATNNNATGNNARFEVGVMTDPDNASTFVPLDTVRLTAVAQWQQHVVDLASYAGSGQYVAFRFAPYNAAYQMYVDDIYLGTCAATNVRIQAGYTSDLFGSSYDGSTAVRLDYTAYHSPTSVNIEYGPQGFTPGGDSSIAVLSVSSSPVNLTNYGIEADDNYDIYVTPVCDDTAYGCFSYPVTLNPRLYPPYCEDFEGYPNDVLPERWKVVNRSNVSGYAKYPLTETQYNQQIVAFYPSTGNNSNIVMLPPLPDGDTLEGKWVYAIFSSQYNNQIFLDFGSLTDTNVASTFVQMASLANSTADVLQEFSAQLTSSLPVGNRLAIRARSTSGARWIRLSKLVFSNYPYPTAINTTPLGIARRRLTWSGIHNNPYYTVEYGYDNHWQTVPSDSCSVILSDLEPGKEYSVYFISPDGERLCLPYTFTNGEYIDLPYCDDFESYDRYAIPDNWSKAQSWTTNFYCPCVERNVWQVSGQQALQFFNNQSSNRWDELTLPDIDVDSIRHATLRFNFRTDFLDNNYMIVGVKTEQNNSNTFIPVDTIPSTISWHNVNVSLARYTGDGRYITFRYKQTNGAHQYAYIDDLHITSCPLPVLTVAGARQVKATLQKADNITPDYWIEYGKGVFAQGLLDTVWNTDSSDYTLQSHSRLVHVTENPFFITDLEPSTTYSFYTLCSEQEVSCAAPITIATAAEYSLPYCEPFNYDGVYPINDWYSYSTYSDNPSYPRSYTGSSAPDNCCASLDFYCNNANTQYIAMPDLDIDSINQAELYFQIYIQYSAYSKLIVGVMTDRSDLSTFVPVDTVSTTADRTYFHKHVSLNRYHGNGRFIAFRFISTSSSRNSIFVDDLRVNSIVTPQIQLTSATTVTITGGSPDYWVEYGLQGTAQGSADNTWLHVVGDTAKVTGLAENTSYSFFYHADSAGVTCFPPVNITTRMSVSMPFCENFNTYASGQMPTGWSAYRMGGCPEPYVNNDHYLFFGNSCNSNNRDYAIMPELDVDSIRNAELYFNMYSDNNSYETLYVGVMTDGSDINTFVIVDTLRCSNSGVWEPKHVSLKRYTGNGRFIAFCAHRTSSCMYLYIDDLYVQACPRPQVALVSGTSVQLSNASADYWVEYGISPITPGMIDTVFNDDRTDTTLVPRNNVLHVTSSEYTIANLQPNTTYDFYSRCDSAYGGGCEPRTAQITTSNNYNVPYCEEFESFPPGWHCYHTYSTDDSDSSTYPRATNVNNCYALEFYTYQGYYSYAVLPHFDVDDIRQLYLNLIILSDDPQYAVIDVGVMRSRYDYSSFVTLESIRNTTANTWEYYSLSLQDYADSTGFIALRMRSTSSWWWSSLYVDYISVSTCDIPYRTETILNSHNSVRIETPAGQESSTGFYVEYGQHGFTQGSGQFVRFDQSPLLIEGLENNTTYDFYYRCDTITPSCFPVHTVTTLDPPIELPYCQDFESTAPNSLPTGWRRVNPHSQRVSRVQNNAAKAHAGSKYLVMKSYNQQEVYTTLPDVGAENIRDITMSFYQRGNTETTLTVGVMSNPDDISTFMPIKQFSTPSEWQRRIVTFDAAPTDGRFIALRYTATNYNYPEIFIDDLYLSTCGATDMRINAVESDYVVFSWRQTGSPNITVEYGEVGFARGQGTTVQINSPSPYTLTGLDHLTNYQFYFDATCDDGQSYCTTNYTDSATVFTPTGGTGCIDPTNFAAAYATCFYGTYGNPYQYVGVVDNGNSSANSRHTIHYDTNERDPRTGGQLRTIPEGADASVRLGNWNTGSQAEAVAYSLAVDTNQFDLLILKYAAVLQNVEHPSADQPRFKLELLDESGNLIDANCAAADFIADMSLGWNIVNEGSQYTLWKDWTTVGIDLAAYHNRTVVVRLTTFDCSNGDHYGYAYFTLQCEHKSLVSDTCGEVDENSFSAPLGFAYSWYTNINSEVFSTDRTIVVPTDDNITYYCRCAFVDKEDCYFTLSAFAGTRYPLARMEYSQEVVDCKINVSLRNTSTITADGINPTGTNEPCETAQWFLDGELVSTNYNASLEFTEAGEHNVRLVAGIANDNCTDTLDTIINVRFNDSIPYISAPDSGCYGTLVDLTVHNVVSQQWYNQQTTPTISVQLGDMSDIVCEAIDSNGCSVSLTHSIIINPVYNITADTIVYYQRFPLLMNDSTIVIPTASNDTTVLFNLASVYGCDSAVAVGIHVVYDVDVTADSTICESQLPLLWNDSLFTEAGSKLVTLKTSHGADSNITMNLAVIPTTYGTQYDTVVENQLPYAFLHHTYPTDTVGDTLMLVNAAGCDSVLTYSLYVHRNVDTTLYDTICESRLPIAWNDSIFATAGVKQTVLLNRHGADSNITMNLAVIPTTYGTQYDTVVENQLPYAFLHHTYPTDTVGDTLMLVNAAGCDSVLTYSLYVHRNVDTTLYDTVCESQLPITWQDSVFDVAAVKSFVVLDQYGADSTVYMNLAVIPTTYGTQYDTVVENQLPYAFLHHTYPTDTVGDTLMLVNAAGCDSVLTYSLYVHRNVSATAEQTICDDLLPYQWNNRLFTEAGTQLDTLEAHTGADSMLTMTLYVNPTYHFEDTLRFCQSALPYTWRDTSLLESTATGTYSRLYATVDGCDSLHVLELTVDSVYDIHDTLALCYDALPYTWRDTTVADSAATNLYALHRTTIASCDSTMTLHLSVHPTYHLYDTLSLCDNLFPYQWRDTTLATVGTADDNGYLLSNHTLRRQSSASCDSTMSLQLTIRPTSLTYDVQEHCDTFTWRNDTTYTATTQTPTVVYTNQHQCDSTVQLDLTIHNSASVVDEVVSCVPYTWIDGREHNEPDSAQVLLQTVDGCDSLVTLGLRLPQPTETFLVDSFCAGTTYLFGGMEITQSGQYVDSLYTTDHCDSVVYIDLTCLPMPVAAIVAEPDCDQSIYNIGAVSDVPFIEWSIVGDDWNPAFGGQHDSLLHFNPSTEMQLLLYADYNSYPTCPTTVEATLYHLVMPEPVMYVIPLVVSPDNPTVSLNGRAAHASTLLWYANGQQVAQGTTGSYTLPVDADSVVITFVAASDVCADTLRQTVYMDKGAMAIPNVFTPTRETNNRFVVYMQDIVEYEIHIYNRQGLLVYHSTDMADAWDGNDLNGHACPGGAYVYHIHYRKQVRDTQWHDTKGSVMLIR